MSHVPSANYDAKVISFKYNNSLTTCNASDFDANAQGYNMIVHVKIPSKRRRTNEKEKKKGVNCVMRLCKLRMNRPLRYLLITELDLRMEHVIENSPYKRPTPQETKAWGSRFSTSYPESEARSCGQCRSSLRRTSSSRDDLGALRGWRIAKGGELC